MKQIIVIFKIRKNFVAKALLYQLISKSTFIMMLTL